MRVIRETGKRTVPFSNLHVGDVFLFCEKPFIKTCAYNIGTTDDFINAACLIDGEMHGFNACDAVEPIDAELIIKD